MTDEEVHWVSVKNMESKKISKFIDKLVRPGVALTNLESAYAKMGKDKAREKKALEWAEVTSKDISNEMA